MKQESAETIALQALAFVISNDDLRDVFMGATGASAEDIKTRAGDAEFLISVLDFLMMDDAWVVRFCDASGFEYTVPQSARQSLPGGAQVHWT
ncbi:MAG: DUF3572 domain-containing protein [Pseudomonadota bacterium]